MALGGELPPNAFEDRRATVIGSVVFCLLWSTLMVGLRLWTRGVVTKQLGIDDYACLIALVREPVPYPIESICIDDASSSHMASESPSPT
jgi:hypothetical protein